VSERLAPELERLLTAGVLVVLVEVAEAKGSTPREAGAAMLVTPERSFGTIGGGRLEWEGTARARTLLTAGEREAWADLPLGPAVGQCCGGRVRLRLRRAGGAELAELEAREYAAVAAIPTVLLFGAGHVGRALARALAPLPVRVRWIDGRPDEFPAEPPPGVEILVTDRPLEVIAAAPAGSAAFVLTHSHSLDFTLCGAVLERGDFAYLGLIGSRTKRARFERGFRELPIPADRVAAMACPIGGDRLRDKRPAVIAALAAAELLLALAGTRTEATANVAQERAA
jgi:xanthine dehydrogenase accessory protein XdhC